MEALGLIETRGLLVAIEGADAMLKAAEVTLLEKTYVGGGLVSIAVTGGVAAVKAAVEAGAAAVNQINAELLISQHVIPRPHEDVNNLIGTVKPPKKRVNQIILSAETEPKEETADDSTTVDLISDAKELTDVKEQKDAKELTVAKEQIDAKELTDAKEQTDAKELIATKELIDAEELATKVEYLTRNAFVEDFIDAALSIENADTKDSTAVDLLLKEVLSPNMNPDKVTKSQIDKLVSEHGLEKALEVLNHINVSKLRSLAREYTDLKITGRRISKADKRTLMTELELHYK